MKKLISFFYIISIGIICFPSQISGQTPEKMSYQAIIRDINDNLLTEQLIGIQISILQGNIGGTASYIERHNSPTNINGLLSIEIGEGTVQTGDFATIDWANGPFFIKTETDLTGGSIYTITGTSQLLSVPYALHAKSAETVTGEINETDPIYELSIAKGITATDTNNWNNKLDQETQTLSDVIAINNIANGQIKNLTDPTDTQDAVTKGYVDALREQLECINNVMLNEGYNGTLMDVERNIYKTIKIGEKTWMAENLKTTKYNNGNSIPYVTDNTEWSGLNTAGYCWFNNDISYSQIYGALYNWYAVETGNLCPVGWHVPTDDEWKELEMALGMSIGDANSDGYRGTNEGSKIGGNADLWTNGVLKSNTEFGISKFAARPAGYRIKNDGFFADIGTHTYWWSATEFNNDNAWSRGLYYNISSIHRTNSAKQVGNCIRCVKD